MIPQNYPIPLLAVLTWQDLDRVFMEKTMGKKMPRSHVLIFRNYGTWFETLEGCFMSVFEQVVMVFDTNNTLFLMKCSKEDMLEGMMLLPMGVSLLLKKCDKEDMLEGIVLPPLPRMQATPRVGSSSSCPSVRLKPGDHPPTRARGSAVSVCRLG